MKLSVAWIFDHIDADWKSVDIPHLVKLFNEKTAEIEGYENIAFVPKNFFIGQVDQFEKDTIILHIPELKIDVHLPYRKDAQKDDLFLITKENDSFAWATIQALNGAKSGLFPAVFVEKDLIAGRWKEFAEGSDVILDIDNKSITHRPDLWGHRGVAREVAALLDLPFKPIDEFIAHKTIKQYEKKAPSLQVHPFAIQNDNPVFCKRFAGLYFDHIQARPCYLWMAHRLAKVGNRPIDLLVDATNYVMLDISQPLHAFDAAKLPKKEIVIRLAKNKEELELLDGQTITLSSHDLVITDGKDPIALAGLMGGKESAVSKDTQSIFLESANFDATVIRRTSTRLHLRTDASARFEKSLDPNQNVTGILRFLKLLEVAQVPMHTCDEIVSLGARAEPITLKVSHAFIENSLGVSISSEFIITTLEKLEFKVTKEHLDYVITVPTYRATKDIGIANDIVEEVGRFYGFDTIEPVFARRQTRPFDLQPVFRKRKIKQFLAYGLQMHELQSYAMYDEEFLFEIGWEPKNYVEVANPSSQNYKRLVGTLVTTLLKAVKNNCVANEQLRFFEWSATWQLEPLKEEQSVAGIFFDKKNKIDFYQAKAKLESLFAQLRLSIEWHPVTETTPWYAKGQTAYLQHKDEIIGIAGKVDQQFLHKLTPGEAFLFELNADYLARAKPEKITYQPLPKYPSVHRDISLFVPLDLTVKKITRLIETADELIKNVRLGDFFEKKEWPDKRAVTLSYEIRHPEKTLTKEEVEVIVDAIEGALQKVGAVIR